MASPKKDGLWATQFKPLTCSLSDAQQVEVNALVRTVGDWVCEQRALLPEVMTEADGVEWKTDENEYKSPVTPLDKQAGEMLYAGLKKITPDIPIITEEMSPEEQQAVLAQAKASAQQLGRKGPTYWAIDPIDGTGSFVRGKDHYAVLAGLVEEGKPTFGVSYFPKLDISFFTRGGEAWEQTKNVTTRLRVGLPSDPTTLRVWKHTGEALATLGESSAKRFGIQQENRNGMDIPYGDAQLLRGKLDLHHAAVSYMEWDLAAYEAISLAAGAQHVNALTGDDIAYGHENFRVPPYWMGHPQVLKRLECARPAVAAGTGVAL